MNRNDMMEELIVTQLDQMRLVEMIDIVGTGLQDVLEQLPDDELQEMHDRMKAMGNTPASAWSH